MSTTYTRSETDTYTEARARYVLGKVYEDMISLFQANFLTKAKCDQWREDLLYIIDKRAMSYFQFQFKKADGSEISSDDNTGGIDYWELPSDTKVSLLVNLNISSINYAEVNEELNNRGWGSGQSLSGTQQYLKSYSKDGFGYKQSKIGAW
jgi:hypothetical protein